MDTRTGNKKSIHAGSMQTADGAAAQPSTVVNFEIPKGACDGLTHIYGDIARFPMAPERTYTPQLASIDEIRALHKALHIERVVIVQPTIYGFDNTCTLDAIRQIGPNACGIAVVDDETPAAVLDNMERGGIRGIRINLETIGLADPAIARQRFNAAVAHVRKRPDWHIQIYTRLSLIEAIYDLVTECPVPVAFDHFAGAKASAGAQEPGFDLLLTLLQSGKAYVRLSAPYLASKLAPGYSDLIPVAKAMIAANPKRILWGTNWPHPNSGRVASRKATDIAPLRQIDDGHILNLLPLWAPDATVRHAILVDNPARLYRF